MQPEVFDTTKNNNIELETANKLVEMYEKQMSQIKNDQQHQHHQQQQQQQQQQNQQQNQQQQQQQQEQQISAVSQTVNQAAINGVVNHQTVSMHQQLQHQQLQSHQQQPQQQQQQLQPVTKEEKQNENQSPSKDTSTETIDVTTVPVTSHQNNLNIILNGSVKQPSPQAPQDPNNTTNLHLPYNREIAPPNSIYGIESLTANKPYDAEVKTLPESIEPPRFPNNFNISSPHHSSPDRDPTRMNHRFDNNWVSPVKAHPFRGLCPPTSPYVDTRDPNNMTAVAGQARRFVPPFYGNGRNFGVHPNVDRSRYGNYSVGSPMMSTLGYPREAMDSRYNLHIAPTLGFEEDKFKLSPPSVEDKHIWTKQEVELLLDLYEEHKSKLQDPRVRKTKVWDDIAKNIHEKLDTDVNGCQCNQKFRNMKADYQKVVEHNARAGSFRKTCKYYERLEKLLTPVSEPEKFKVEGGEGDASKFINGLAYTNGFGSKTGTPNGTNFYDREMPSSHSSSSPDSSEKGNGKYENSGSGLSGTPNSPEKRLLNQIETTGDDESPPPSKRPCSDCSCGGINKRELIDVLKDFLREQRKREEETICKIQTLHKEKIDAVVKFLDLFQELVKKV